MGLFFLIPPVVFDSVVCQMNLLFGRKRHALWLCVSLLYPPDIGQSGGNGQSTKSRLVQESSALT